MIFGLQCWIFTLCPPPTIQWQDNCAAIHSASVGQHGKSVKRVHFDIPWDEWTGMVDHPAFLVLFLLSEKDRVQDRLFLAQKDSRISWSLSRKSACHWTEAPCICF
jgi:hypothetical protein